MLPARTVATIRRLQRDLWSASRAVASPVTDLVLERPDGTVLPAQAVVVIWAKTSGQRTHVTARGDDTPAIDVTFRRLASDGFTVETGWRFTIDGNRGVVARVVRNKAIVRAECRLVTGSVWPS